MADPIPNTLATEAARIEEDVLYSAKGHFEASRRWAGMNLAIGIPTIAAGAAASATALKSYVGTAGMLSAVAAVGAALLTFLKPSDRAAQHAQAGNAYKSLQNRTRIFREIDCTMGADHATLAAALKKLAAERDDLNVKSPIIPRGAFKKARRGIEAGEAAYRVDPRPER